jgi:transcriptional regulator with XRE-family HTH domain
VTNKPTTENGARVRKARKAKRLSQAQLAKLCNVTQATVQKIETGRSINSRFLPKIWAGLGLPLEELDPAYKANGAATAIENDDNAVDLEDMFDQFVIDFRRQLRKQRSRR